MNTTCDEATYIIAHPDMLVSPAEHRRLLARLVSEVNESYEAGVKFGMAQQVEK